MTVPLITARIADKSFDGNPVLKDISLSINPGEVVVLLGPSGCGKSTLLRILAGLDTRYTGAVTVEGRDIKDKVRDVGVVFQEPRLMPWLSVADNIAFSTRRPAGLDPHVATLLGEVGLQGRGGSLPKALSGGQAQRASIARGLFTKPRVLLLDEPFSAVDAFTRARLQDLLARIAVDRQLTIVLVTHDIDEALHLADRVLVMDVNPGTIRMDVRIDQSRPRKRNAAAVAGIKDEILDCLTPAEALSA